MYGPKRKLHNSYYEYIYLIGKWNICMLVIFPGILDSYTYCVLMCLK